MPRIIRIDEKQEKQVTHRECGAVIGYFKNEEKSYLHHDYGGGSDTVYYITCPHCNEKIVLRS